MNESEKLSLKTFSPEFQFSARHLQLLKNCLFNNFRNIFYWTTLEIKKQVDFHAVNLFQIHVAVILDTGVILPSELV